VRTGTKGLLESACGRAPRSAGLGRAAPIALEIAGARTNRQSSDRSGKGRGNAALRRQRVPLGAAAILAGSRESRNRSYFRVL
jgi:hypothetical protein